MDIASHPRLLALLSAAHALGTLRGPARRRFETIAREQPAVRVSALLWRERLTGFVELTASVEPPAAVWTRIRNLVDAELARERQAVLRAKPIPPPPPAARWWHSLVLWRGVAAFGLCATVLSAWLGAAGWLAPSASGALQYVAILADDAAAPALLVTVDPSTRQLTLQRVGSYREAPDRSLQLWALPPGQAPRSLGVLQASGPGMRLPADLQALAQAPALAISLEPLGGVPGAGGPTGPVLFKGPLVEKTL